MSGGNGDPGGVMQKTTCMGFCICSAAGFEREDSGLEKKILGHMPEHKFSAYGAEEGELSVRALNAYGIMHHAIRIVAVAEPEGMAKLMNGFFFHPVGQWRTPPFGITVRVSAQPVGGDHGSFATELGFAKDVFEDGAEEIQVGYPQDLQGIRRADVEKLLEDQIGVVLLSGSIQCMGRKALIFNDSHFRSEVDLDAFGNAVQMQHNDIAQGYHVDDSGAGDHGFAHYCL